MTLWILCFPGLRRISTNFPNPKSWSLRLMPKNVLIESTAKFMIMIGTSLHVCNSWNIAKTMRRTSSVGAESARIKASPQPNFTDKHECVQVDRKFADPRNRPHTAPEKISQKISPRVLASSAAMAARSVHYTCIHFSPTYIHIHAHARTHVRTHAQVNVSIRRMHVRSRVWLIFPSCSHVYMYTEKSHVG